MKKTFLLKTLLLLCALVVGGATSAWADEPTVKSESWTFNGSDTWTSGMGTYCGLYGSKKDGFTVKNSSISNFSDVDFSKVISPSVTIEVNGLTNSGTNSYTVCLVDKDGNDVGTSVTKTNGLGNGSNSASSKSSSVVLTPVSGATGYRITCPVKAALKGTGYTLTYTEVPANTVATPTFSPAAGAVTKGTTVTISCGTDGATIHYTTDGTTPTTESATYSDAITINESQTIKAIAVKTDMTDSEVATADYTIKVNAPTFSIAEGVFDVPQSVELSCTTEGTTIYYTTDGSTPTESSTEYAGAISVSSTTTIKAIAVKSGLVNSDVVSATYTLRVATPTFSLAQGEYDTTQSVELSCATDGATIYYTLDGKTPTSSNTEYTGAISVSSITTIKAIAIKDGLTNSEVASAEYRVILPASLPFSYNSGRSSIAGTTGLTESGLGSDYASAPLLKFDSTGDNLILKFNAAPTELSFKIKGNSFSGGTFKVQYSANGSDYTDLATYTTLGDTQTETFDSDDLPATTRFIKWIYTEKVNGNVGLGAISLTGHVSATMGTNGYTTFADKHALDLENLPSGLTAYKAGVTGSTVTFTEINDQAVPANTGLLLKGVAGETYNIPVAASGTDVTGNAFLVNTAGTTFTGDDNYYYFGLKKNTLTFGLFDPASVAIPANKAYLKVSKGAGARELTVLFDDEATGIEDLTPALSKGERVVYDLSGRRVVTPTKGLYIVNGRKVVVK